MRRFLFSLAALVALLTGCFDQRTLLKKLIPEQEDQHARRFIGFVQTGQIDKALEMLDGSLDESKARGGLEELRGLFNQSRLVDTETIGYFMSRNFTTGKGNQRVARLDYQIKLEQGWLAGFVTLVGEPDTLKVNSARFNPLSASLETMNAFTFPGKSVGHYLMMLTAGLVPMFCLVVLIICIRSKIRRKWLWILFIILPVGKIHLNWTSGEWGYQLLAVQLFGTSVFKAGLYAPWLLSVGFPVGALSFLVKRKSLAPPTDSLKPPPLLQ